MSAGRYTGSHEPETVAIQWHQGTTIAVQYQDQINTGETVNLWDLGLTGDRNVKDVTVPFRGARQSHIVYLLK